MVANATAQLSLPPETPIATGAFAASSTSTSGVEAMPWRKDAGLRDGAEGVKAHPRSRQLCANFWYGRECSQRLLSSGMRFHKINRASAASLPRNFLFEVRIAMRFHVATAAEENAKIRLLIIGMVTVNLPRLSAVLTRPRTFDLPRLNSFVQQTVRADAFGLG